MNNLQVFNFNGNPIRVLGTQDKPLFVAKDICNSLGISNPSWTIQFVDSDDLSQTEIIDSLGRKQLAWVLTELGLYTLVLRSDKPEAKAFKRWVTSEVLPSIRKHSAYSTTATAEAMINDPDVMIKALTALKEERIAKINSRLEEKEAQKEKEQAQNQLSVVSEERDNITLKLDAVTSAEKPLFLTISIR